MSAVPPESACEGQQGASSPSQEPETSHQGAVAADFQSEIRNHEAIGRAAEAPNSECTQAQSSCEENTHCSFHGASTQSSNEDGIAEVRYDSPCNVSSSISSVHVNAHSPGVRFSRQQDLIEVGERHGKTSD